MSALSLYLRELSWQCKTWLRYSPALPNKHGLKSLDRLLLSFDAQQRQTFSRLKDKYNLSDWSRLCNQGEYRENLYVLDLLDQHLDIANVIGKGLDIGCKDFSYLPALSAFFKGPWDGVELDAHARYWNGFTRRAYGQWMARQRDGASYISGSVLELGSNYQCIVWILPFVRSGPLEQWGLPMRFFQPQALLSKAWGLLNEGGVMLIVNQGEVEAEAQQGMFAELGIEAKSLGQSSSVFSPFQNARYAWKVIKSKSG